MNSIQEILKPILKEENLIQEVVTLLGSSRKRTDNEEDDLRLEEVEGTQQLGAALSHMFLEWGIKNASFSSVLPKLLEIRCSAMRRNHSLLITSAKAYFKFLRLGHSVS